MHTCSEYRGRARAGPISKCLLTCAQLHGVSSWFTVTRIRVATVTKLVMLHYHCARKYTEQVANRQHSAFCCYMYTLSTVPLCTHIYHSEFPRIPGLLVPL